MLSPDDKAVVDHDPELPALRLFLDDDLALEVFNKYHPQLLATKATCTYLRYKPRTSCLAAYTVSTNSSEHHYLAKAYPKADSAKISKVLSRSVVQGPSSNQNFEVPQFATVISAFPYDDELAGLQSLYANTASGSLISRLVPERSDLQDARIVTLRYKPERRYVARLDVAGQHAAVLKIHSKSRYRQARRAMKSLGSQNIASAKPIGHSDRYCALLFSWINGSTLSSNMEAGRANAANFLSAGSALSELHRLTIGKIPQREHLDDIRQIQQQSEGYHYLGADLEGRLQTLAFRCAAALDFDRSKQVPTHGDFHPGQVVVNADHASIIDLDNLAAGSTEYDLGNFIACLERAVLVGVIRENEKQHYIEAFLSGYMSEKPASIDPHLLTSYAASGLLRTIHEPFRHRASNWREQQEAIVAKAEELSPPSSKRSVSTLSFATRKEPEAHILVDDPHQIHQDGRLPKIAEALTPESADQVIGSIAREVYKEDDLTLEAIRVCRHKPGRRAILAYEFYRPSTAGALTLLGKVNAKNRHANSFRLQQELWENGFDYQSRDGISVARPVATVANWHMWLQEYVPGQNGWDALLGPESELAAVRMVDAVMKLHQANIPTQRKHSLKDEIAILEIRLQQFVASRPELKQRVNAVLDACRELACTLTPAKSIGIHRDFYPDQVLFTHNRTYLLDLDLYCLGSPSLDISNLCAHLRELGIRQSKHASMLCLAEKAIVERYLSSSSARCQRELAALTSLSLVRHIYLSSIFKERHHATASILAECEQRLGVKQPVQAINGLFLSNQNT